MYNKNAWEKYINDTSKIMGFAEEYINFISDCKTERLCVKESVRLAKKAGFVEMDSLSKLQPGDKVYKVNHNKNVCLFIVGKKDIREGLRILGAHIDSPRLDLKPNPLYEKAGFALFDTHYYGGIKKYQWVTLPLSLIGVIALKNGKTIDVNIGEDPSDPVFGVNDLLIHLSHDQMSKKADVVIEGEDLDIIVGNIPSFDKDTKNCVKANVLNILKQKYNITEEDLMSAEIEVVPSGRARSYGLDSSMVMGYGQDDRSCAYTSLRAILETNNPEYTSCCILVDKEEIGSVGATGAQSEFFQNTIYELLDKLNITSLLDLNKTITNSWMLSSDVEAGYDPIYFLAYDKNNCSKLGYGLVLKKYTGARGKSGSNDADAEYIAKIRNILDTENINFQFAELGRVDQGGGGTIAYILANKNMNVLDAGVAVINMHSPWEITSKVDLYEAYLGYLAFLK